VIVVVLAGSPDKPITERGHWEQQGATGTEKLNGASTVAEGLVVVESRDRLLTPGEVASLFRVDPKTVTRWAAAGRINSIRTPGGHRRFRESEIRELLRQDGAKPTGPAGGTVMASAAAPAPRQAGDDQPAARS
jgi:excisionase family DNA binding protein